MPIDIQSAVEQHTYTAFQDERAYSGGCSCGWASTNEPNNLRPMRQWEWHKLESLITAAEKRGYERGVLTAMKASSVLDQKE